MCYNQQNKIIFKDMFEDSVCRLEVAQCSGMNPLPGIREMSQNTCTYIKYKIRLRNCSVVGRLSGGRGLNSLVYGEGQ